jgi:hypothetical protein
MLTKRSIAPSLTPGDKYYALGPVDSVKKAKTVFVGGEGNHMNAHT